MECFYYSTLPLLLLAGLIHLSESERDESPDFAGLSAAGEKISKLAQHVRHLAGELQTKTPKIKEHMENYGQKLTGLAPEFNDMMKKIEEVRESGVTQAAEMNIARLQPLMGAGGMKDREEQMERDVQKWGLDKYKPLPQLKKEGIPYLNWHQ